MRSTVLDIEPLTGVIGATVVGVDLAREVSGPALEEIAATLAAALDDHHVIVLPDQHLSPDEQVELSHAFGPPAETPFVGTMPDHPEVIRVIKEADEGAAFNFGGAWHSDFSFLARPPSYTLLHAIDVPRTGGDTVFTSMVAALDQLPDDLRAAWTSPEPTACTRPRDAYSPKLQALHDGLGSMDIRTDESANEAREHPLVCTHPTSGRPSSSSTRPTSATWSAPTATVPSTGVLRHRLHDHSTDHRFTVRHRWRNGDLVIWDNRATQHLALNDYAGQRRELHRTTVEGTVPS